VSTNWDKADPMFKSRDSLFLDANGKDTFFSLFSLFFACCLVFGRMPSFFLSRQLNLRELSCMATHLLGHFQTTTISNEFELII
jgi:hypothetical protein